jgi:hypothetical protein
MCGKVICEEEDEISIIRMRSGAGRKRRDKRKIRRSSIRTNMFIKDE